MELIGFIPGHRLLWVDRMARGWRGGGPVGANQRVRPERRAQLDITPNLGRVSAGVEEAEGLLSDLLEAPERAEAA